MSKSNKSETQVNLKEVYQNLNQCQKQINKNDFKTRDLSESVKQNTEAKVK